MTCRHAPGDPAHGQAAREAAAYDMVQMHKKLEDLERRSNNTKFEIVDLYECPAGLILKVRYPDCSACFYEGTKILVYVGKSVRDAIKWRKIDPHFADPAKVRPANEAPPPSARFPASSDGWNGAVEYLHLDRKKVR
jgi:hypothetical protein